MVLKDIEITVDITAKRGLNSTQTVISCNNDCTGTLTGVVVTGVYSTLYCVFLCLMLL